MKQFTTAAKGNDDAFVEGAEPVTFQIDDREVTATPINDGAMMLVMAKMGSSSMSEQASAITLFMESVFDRATVRWLTDRLADRRDPFGSEDLNEIVRWLMDEWTNPPQVDGDREPAPSTPQDGSSESSPRTGKKSTAKRH